MSSESGCGCLPSWGRRRRICLAVRKALSKTKRLFLWQGKHQPQPFPSSSKCEVWSCSSWMSAISSEEDWFEQGNYKEQSDGGSKTSTDVAGTTTTDSLTTSCFGDGYSVINEELDWGPHKGPTPTQLMQPCVCNFACHSCLFHPDIPINSPVGVPAGTYEELLIHARSICGHWITLNHRSQSLETQMQYIGLAKFKRAIMNRYTVPFGALLEREDTLLRCWIGTPLGNKYMHADLLGGAYTDVDREVGTWTGVAKMVDMSIPWFCQGRPVRALQLKRISNELGTAYETRVVLPDIEEGRIMLFNIALYPPNTNPPIFVDRILKFLKPM